MTSFSLTSLHLALVGVRPEERRAGAGLVGATLFSCSVGGHLATFELRSALLDPSDPAGFMREWIDARLADRGPVIAGYDFGRAVHTVDSDREPVLSPRTVRMLTGRSVRPVIDLKLVSEERYADFRNACHACGIPTDRRVPLEVLDDWILGRRATSLMGMQVDAIATWRLALSGLGTQSMAGGGLRDAMSAGLARWLRETGVPAGRPHLEGPTTRKGGTLCA